MTAERAGPPSPRTGPALSAWLAVGLATAVVAVALGGAAPQEPPPGLPGPGALPGWSLPLLRLAGYVAALTAAGLALACLLGQVRLRRAGIAAAAVAWAGLSLASLLLGLSEITARPVRAVLREDLLRFYGLEVPQGRALLLSAGLAGVLAVTATLVRGPLGAALLLVLTLAALVPPLLEGHAAALDDHRQAQTALVVHVLAAVLWVAGLAALSLASAGPRLATAARRFSPLALGCAATIGLSGLVSSWLRLDTPGQLVSTGYGVLLLAKSVAFALLVAAGAAHRRRTLPLLDAGRPSAFRRLAVGEVAVMAAAYGLAVALSRTPLG